MPLTGSARRQLHSGQRHPLLQWHLRSAVWPATNLDLRARSSSAVSVLLGHTPECAASVQIQFLWMDGHVIYVSTRQHRTRLLCVLISHLLHLECGLILHYRSLSVYCVQDRDEIRRSKPYTHLPTHSYAHVNQPRAKHGYTRFARYSYPKCSIQMQAD